MMTYGMVVVFSVLKSESGNVGACWVSRKTRSLLHDVGKKQGPVAISERLASGLFIKEIINTHMKD